MSLSGETDIPQPAEKVHVLLGNQGEYSDRTVWVAGVFRDQAEARFVVEDREARVRAAIAQGEEGLRERLKAIDPELDDWYSDSIYYHVYETTIR